MLKNKKNTDVIFVTAKALTISVGILLVLSLLVSLLIQKRTLPDSIMLNSGGVVLFIASYLGSVMSLMGVSGNRLIRASINGGILCFLVFVVAIICAKDGIKEVQLIINLVVIMLGAVLGAYKRKNSKSKKRRNRTK